MTLSPRALALLQKIVAETSQIVVPMADVEAVIELRVAIAMELAANAPPRAP